MRRRKERENGCAEVILESKETADSGGAKSSDGQTVYKERGAKGKESASSKASSDSETEDPTGSLHLVPEKRAGDVDDGYESDREDDTKREASQRDEVEGEREETEGGHPLLKSVEQESPRSIIMKGLAFSILAGAVSFLCPRKFKSNGSGILRLLPQSCHAAEEQKQPSSMVTP